MRHVNVQMVFTAKSKNSTTSFELPCRLNLCVFAWSVLLGGGIAEGMLNSIAVL